MSCSTPRTVKARPSRRKKMYIAWRKRTRRSRITGGRWRFCNLVIGEFCNFNPRHEEGQEIEDPLQRRGPLRPALDHRLVHGHEEVVAVPQPQRDVPAGPELQH